MIDQEAKIICNKIKCLKCLDIIISHHVHDFKSCKCTSVSVDGGRSYTRRLFQDPDDYVDLTVYSTAPYRVIRENVYRGSRGVTGYSPLAWIKLSEIDDSYLANLISYCESEGDTSGDYQYYLKERDYRNGQLSN
jgi:hypothetical protein